MVKLLENRVKSVAVYSFDIKPKFKISVELDDWYLVNIHKFWNKRTISLASEQK